MTEPCACPLCTRIRKLEDALRRIVDIDSDQCWSCSGGSFLVTIAQEALEP